MSEHYYRPSGRVPASAYPAAVLIAAGLIPFAWLYAWLIIHAPLVFNFFIAFAYACAIGWLTRLVAARGKVRNAAWISRAGIIFGLLGWYLQWAAWAALTICAPGGMPVGATFVAFVTQPWLLTRFAVEIAAIGTMNISGWPLKEGWLAGIWIVELAMHLMLAPLLGRMRVDEPFCEVTGAWAEKIAVPRRFLPVDAAQARRLEADPQAIRTLMRPSGPDESGSHAEVMFYRTGGTETYVSIANVLVSVGKKGNKESTREPVLEYLRLPGAKVDELIAYLTAEDNAAAGQAIAAELAAALDYLQTERYAEALNAAMAQVRSKDAGLRADASRICGLACSRLAHWQGAADYFTTLFEDEPTAHNALQIATSSVMAGVLPVGLKWMEEAGALNAVTEEVPPMTLLTSFVTALKQAGHEAEAMPFIDRIRQAYTDLGCTDPTFLHLRAMPFFSAFLSNSLHFVRASLAPDEGRRWYAQMLSSLDPEGRDALGAWLDSEFGPASGHT